MLFLTSLLQIPEPRFETKKNYFYLLSFCILLVDGCLLYVMGPNLLILNGSGKLFGVLRL